MNSNRSQKSCTKSRESETKKESTSTCVHYPTCEREEKKQGRCNSRCCRKYKKAKKT